jgi:alpha,alpha-trehalose phosphorylase
MSAVAFAPPPALVCRSLYDAVLFDLDGVLTETAALHARCWKQAFDPLVAAWGRRFRRVQAPFDVARDYVRFVDGKPREAGARDFLLSRGIELPDGRADAPPGEWSVNGVANAKQALVERALRRDWIGAFPGSVRWVRWLRGAGVATAVVSSSTNCTDVLHAAGIADLFELTVDGHDVARLGLAGKPAPDGFLEAAARLGVAPERAVVVEDALSGVAAGRAGGFGLVIGVAHGAPPSDLLVAGADAVVDDLAELLPGGRNPMPPR